MGPVLAAILARGFWRGDASLVSTNSTNWVGERACGDRSAPAFRSLETIVTEVDADIAAMPFEKALAELEGIVDKLEKGAVSLDDSVKLYERGEALKKRCDELLKNAEMRIEKITLTADGKPKGLTPLDGD
jgi:exodeoxyribonuclease VII small subunit